MLTNPCDAFMSEMDQIGIFEVENLVPYLTWDQSGPKMFNFEKCCDSEIGV